MSHDEFLHKITNETALEDIWMAMQKVVQLHEPYDDGESVWCQGCWQGIEEGYADYPCETIQTIEKALQ